MNHKDFGDLVRALRDDMGLSQSALASQMGEGFTRSIISNIEFGARTGREADTLVALANALQLTSQERKEFFHAALGIETGKTVRPVKDPRKILKEMTDMMERLRLPAFLVDVYGDIVRANIAIIRLVGIPHELLTNASLVPAGYNLMRVIFDRDVGFKSLVGNQNWDQIARHNMAYFRTLSLRHRHKPYFSYIKGQLDLYTDFKEYWRSLSKSNWDSYSTSILYEYNHKELGKLSYFSMSGLTLTSHGEFSLTVYMPASERTAVVFREMVDEASTEVLQLAPWPEKIII